MDGAGDENRTRTVSLGTADRPAQVATSVLGEVSRAAWNDRGWPWLVAREWLATPPGSVYVGRPTEMTSQVGSASEGCRVTLGASIVQGCRCLLSSRVR